MDEEEITLWSEGDEWPLHLLTAPLVSLILAERVVVLLAQMHDGMAENAAADNVDEAVTYHRARSAYLRRKASKAADESRRRPH